MERFFKKISRTEGSSSSANKNFGGESLGKTDLETLLEQLPSDRARRTRILNYDPNIRDIVRRHYLLMGLCQPRNHNFPQKIISEKKKRRFGASWFDDYPDWLEYNIENDVAYCLHSYLFKPNHGEQGGSDVFSGKGFSYWKKPEALDTHVGGVGSAHNQASLKFQALMNQKKHIESIISHQLESSKHNYYTLLNASIDCIRFLLRQGLAFRGHDESITSNNRGNFIELLEFLADHNDSVKAVAFENASGNLQLTAPAIQKDIVNAAAVETLNAIMFDMGDALFSILIDEA